MKIHEHPWKRSVGTGRDVFAAFAGKLHLEGSRLR